MRDSSLSAGVQGVVASRVGHDQLAYDYWRETALVDLHDVAGNTDDGLHLAALAGAWLVAVAGFGGLRDHTGELSFNPSLPPTLSRLAFRVVYRDSRIRVEIVPGEARYELTRGGPVDLLLDGRTFTLHEGKVLVLPWTSPPQEEDVAPPKGREPLRRGVGADLDAPVHDPWA